MNWFIVRAGSTKAFQKFLIQVLNIPMLLPTFSLHRLVWETPAFRR
jgi:hypothetical protein